MHPFTTARVPEACPWGMHEQMVLRRSGDKEGSQPAMPSAVCWGGPNGHQCPPGTYPCHTRQLEWSHVAETTSLEQSASHQGILTAHVLRICQFVYTHNPLQTACTVSGTRSYMEEVHSRQQQPHYRGQYLLLCTSTFVGMPLGPFRFRIEILNTFSAGIRSPVARGAGRRQQLPQHGHGAVGRHVYGL